MNSVSLKEVSNIQTGKLDANAAVADGAYPFFTCGQKPERIDKYAFDTHALLLAGNNAQGNFHLQSYNGKFNAYQRTYVIINKEGFDLDYIGYSIEMALKHLKKVSQGSQTKFLTKAILDNFQVSDIPLHDQESLIASIKAIDKQIALNQQINDNLAA